MTLLRNQLLSSTNMPFIQTEGKVAKKPPLQYSLSWYSKIEGRWIRFYKEFEAMPSVIRLGQDVPINAKIVQIERRPAKGGNRGEINPRSGSGWLPTR